MATSPNTLPEDSWREDELINALAIIWARKRLIVIVGLLFGGLGAAYAFMAPSWYRSDVLVAPVDDRSAGGLAAQFGGLASLAGLTMPASKTAEPLAVLQSRQFAKSFIEQENLLPTLFADEWDAAANRWNADLLPNGKDMREGVDFFVKKVRSIREDKKTGLVTVSIEWKDPVVAAKWANLLVARANDRIRTEALADAARNVAFLRKELGATTIVSMQQPIGRLLEAELQKVMLAGGAGEYAFKVIDRAEPPRRRSRPNRVLAVGLSTALGFVLATVFVLASSALRSVNRNAAPG